MLGSKKSEDKMTALETWQSICNVVDGFLGRSKTEYENSAKTTANILLAWKQTVTENTLYLYSYLDLFRPN